MTKSIETVAELERHYGIPSVNALAKVKDRLTAGGADYDSAWLKRAVESMW